MTSGEMIDSLIKNFFMQFVPIFMTIDNPLELSIFYPKQNFRVGLVVIKNITSLDSAIKLKLTYNDSYRY